MRSFHHIILGLALCGSLLCAPVSHSVAQENVANLMLRALGFVRGLSVNAQGDIPIAIVYNPANASSAQEARDIKERLSQNRKTRKGMLRGELLPVSAIQQDNKARAFVLTSNMREHYASVKKAALSRRAFVISADPECARQNYCVVSIDQSAGTKIYLNESVLDEIGLDIDTTFRYLAIRL